MLYGTAATTLLSVAFTSAESAAEVKTAPPLAVGVMARNLVRRHTFPVVWNRVVDTVGLPRGSAAIFAASM
ncbi:Os02g0483101 [Oryza sativa Japonica Group]|uniref:Os02g0483101 protein n=1 Tax=Oryza sativa subsp. japonica TaxID=39947 RepID=A0A0N7KFA8_ORYSJ|nr:Os02g0483101 [Oryza sativa Japonica Group]